MLKLLFIFIFILLLLTFIIFKKIYYENLIGKRKQNRDEYGYIYFYRGKWEFTNLLLVKIGRTNNIKKRISSAKTSNPFGIWLLAVVRVKDDVFAESLIHKKFGKYRINKKNEWFFYPPIIFFMLCVKDWKLTNSEKRSLNGKVVDR